MYTFPTLLPRLNSILYTNRFLYDKSILLKKVYESRLIITDIVTLKKKNDALNHRVHGDNNAHAVRNC